MDGDDIDEGAEGKKGGVHKDVMQWVKEFSKRNGNKPQVGANVRRSNFRKSTEEINELTFSIKETHSREVENQLT